MRIWRVFVGLTLTAALALGAYGCTQGRGERCQVDADCSSGLVCYTALSQSVPPEGECEPSGYAGQDDAGVQEDAGPEAAPQADAAQEDALQEDAGTDAGTD